MPTTIYLHIRSAKGQKTDSQRAELETWLRRQRTKGVQWFRLCQASAYLDTSIYDD